MARALKAAFVTMAAIVLPLTFTATPAHATPPNIPSYSNAVSRLAALTVTAESHHSTYDRDLFPHWITITGSCNTREQVLKRDGSNVVVNSSCYPTSGSWYSPYDGATWTNPATWQPPLSSFRCTYAKAWIQAKWYYSLTVDSAEKTALNNMLATC